VAASHEFSTLERLRSPIGRCVLFVIFLTIPVFHGFSTLQGADPPIWTPTFLRCLEPPLESSFRRPTALLAKTATKVPGLPVSPNNSASFFAHNVREPPQPRKFRFLICFFFRSERHSPNTSPLFLEGTPAYVILSSHHYSRVESNFLGLSFFFFFFW